MSLSTYYLEYGRHLARPRELPLATITRENQFMGFVYFPIWVWGSAWQPFGPPELRYKTRENSKMYLNKKAIAPLNGFSWMNANYRRKICYLQIKKEGFGLCSHKKTVRFIIQYLRVS